MKAVGDRHALPVAPGRDVVDVGEEGPLLRPEDREELVAAPDVELALVSFRIGVEACGEGAALQAHLADEPADRLLDPQAEERVAGRGVGGGEELDQLGVVVEHLLEVRYEPALVDGVAGEAAADVIVDAALARCG